VRFADKGNCTTFKKHLKKVLWTNREAPEIIMVVDNVAYHHAKRIAVWLEKNPKLSFVFLPPYSPDLNAIE
jgi:transposase